MNDAIKISNSHFGPAAGLTGLFVLLLSGIGHSASTPPVLPSNTTTTNDSANRTLNSDAVLEQGKQLYESGQYVAALDKFMKVLRRDPQQPEARQYLRLVVDQLRTKRATANPYTRTSTPSGTSTRPVKGKPTLSTTKASVPAAFLDGEVKKRVRQRKLLALDLAAIPGVNINVGAKQSQIEIKTSLLFADMTGGLREGGIPLLDRVAAWLKTFGQQPIAIHCFPEELDNANSSLFLHRYAQLYGFFADEHQIPATRFVNTDLPKTKDKDKDNDFADSQSAQGDLAVSTENAKIVIVSMGGSSADDEETVSPKSVAWLEFSIMASRPAFVPQEGDSATLDLAALAKSGVKEWYFKISPAGTNTKAVMTLEGKGNLLRRVSWDGRDQKSGSFVAPGTYTCKLYAANAENMAMSREIPLTIQQVGMTAAPEILEQPKTVAVKPKPKPKPKPQPKAAKPPVEQTSAPAPSVAALPEATIPAVPPPKVVLPPDAPAEERSEETKPAASAAPAEHAEPDESDESSNAIWKQVIQFDRNEMDLKPTLKASLERIGKTLEVYPLQKVRIMGFAERTETNASGLAKQRADMIRQTLIKEYQVDPSRIIVAGGRVGSSGKVEISITN